MHYLDRQEDEAAPSHAHRAANFISRANARDYRAYEVEQTALRDERNMSFDAELTAMRRLVDMPLEQLIEWSGIYKNRMMWDNLCRAYQYIREERMMLDMELERLRERA